MPYNAKKNAGNYTSGKLSNFFTKKMTQHRQAATSSGQHSAVHLHVNETQSFLEDNQVCVD